MTLARARVFVLGRPLATVLLVVGLALLTGPLFVHSHASHDGHLGFQVWVEEPGDENATILAESAVSDEIVGAIREAARADESGESVVVHTSTAGVPLENGLTTTPGHVYVRTDSTTYRLTRFWHAGGGFFDPLLVIQGAGVVIVVSALVITGLQES